MFALVIAGRGDWYARNMYLDGSKQYKFQREHYGPPSRFGYKDQWTLLDWDPEEWIQRPDPSPVFLTMATLQWPTGKANGGKGSIRSGSTRKASVRCAAGYFLYQDFLRRTRDLISMTPTCFISTTPSGGMGRHEYRSYFYNRNLKTRGRMEAIINFKEVPARASRKLWLPTTSAASRDYAVPLAIRDCIGDWHYDRALFEHPGRVRDVSASAGISSTAHRYRQ